MKKALKRPHLAPLGQAWTKLSGAIMRPIDQAFRTSRQTRENGAATVEFVIMLPIFMGVFLASFEASLFSVRNVMLERATDIAAREIRTATSQGTLITPGFVRAEICEHVRIMSNCNTNLLVDLREIDMTTWDVPRGNTPCAGDVDPPNFEDNRDNKLLLMRACFLVQPVIPISAIGADLASDEDGNIRMVSSTIFMVE